MYPETSLAALADERIALTALLLYAGLMMLGTIAALVVTVRLVHRPPDWACLRTALAGGPWRWQDLGFVLLSLLGLQAVTGACTWLIMHSGWLPHGAASGLPMMILGSLILDGAGLLALYGYLRWRGVAPDAALNLRQAQALTGLRSGAVAYLAVLPLLFTTALVYQFILLRAGIVPSLQNVAEIMLQARDPLTLTYLLLLATVLAPLYEECLFRGIVLPVLLRRMGTGPAIALTSLIFAAIHMHLPSLAPLFVVSVGFSLAYLYTGSLWASICMHAIFNGVNLTLICVIRPTP